METHTKLNNQTPKNGQIVVHMGVKYKAVYCPLDNEKRCQLCTFNNPLCCQKPKDWGCINIYFERVVKRLDSNDNVIR